ncbi:MAG: DnaJ domain-containing protein [Rhodospirillales bacterium]|jgi:DnaJ-class molecular chaperone|nr:DnaJ domain-containing protein [Rhodospirillales bacterium]MBT4041378.1 DnaJ domain-containing protein [Rhodospirillales bacterium]MBT4628187.1 DnaJ domain-containing protein [Rhodospirillales bacterium]MBT5351792.1 DnaJ domain-containing protein [Rhodospirillales bacterium]MBT5519962.1 DnaJ domain-containing protein [Rhodospirillales bacterium]
MRSLYKILGLSKRATADEIKAAFRKQARDKHPDANANNPKAEESFKELNQAYAILSDPDQRASYDRGDIDEAGAAKRPKGARKSNPFDEFAKRYTKSREDKMRNVRIMGADVSYILRVSFMDAVRGAIKHVSMTSGKRLKVTIPPGTRHEQVLRLKKQGMSGIGGGADGDALVEILVDGNDVFRIEGDDICLDLAITLPEAVLGARVEAPTVDGTVNVTIPANSNTGSFLRLRAKGMPRKDGNRGDQLIRLMVTLPNKPDSALNEFMKSWKPPSSYSVRKKTVKSD